MYAFAGEYRRENIIKENFLFSDYSFIPENLRNILKKIDLEKLKNENFGELTIFISQIMTDLNVLHPFREGNGRATREFIRELLEDLGYEIFWFDIEYQRILNASKKAVVDETDQIQLLRESIVKKS